MEKKIYTNIKTLEAIGLKRTYMCRSKEEDIPVEDKDKTVLMTERRYSLRSFLQDRHKSVSQYQKQTWNSKDQNRDIPVEEDIPVEDKDKTVLMTERRNSLRSFLQDRHKSVSQYQKQTWNSKDQNRDIPVEEDIPVEDKDKTVLMTERRNSLRSFLQDRHKSVSQYQKQTWNLKDQNRDD
ncbi:hypothetical protein Bca101_068389 [Brassica carinata]